ncbi:MAG: hypothetical protein KJ550_02955, partial [Proteobacteria bacterium]|nr:hypothetical protein [Pseudomonadota bacterium]
MNERKQADVTARQLFSDFHLNDLYENSSADNFRQNLFYLEMLERAFSEADVKIPQNIVAADIGPSDWFYVKALYAALKWWSNPDGREVQLTGYEADAFRVYPNGFSRYDFAQSYIQGLEKVQYIPEKFTRQPEKYDLITMLFPFVFIKDHLKWGLPFRRFDAYSAQIGHQFRSIPATCSRVNRPPDRSEATLVFYYFSDLFFLVKEDR